MYYNIRTSCTPHYGYENVPFEVPESWEWVKLGDIATVINGKSQSDVINPNGIYPIYGSGGIMGYANDYLCPEHCTIIGRKGTINNPILVETKFWNVDTAFGMSPNNNIDYHYFYFFCESFDFTSLDKSTTLPSLTKTNIELIDIPLPPRQEQSRIVSEIQKLFAFINQIEDDKHDLQDVIKYAKYKILDLAIRGKLVERDPNDEPATVLLNRIAPHFVPCDTSHYGNILSNWTICTLIDVIDLLDNRRKPIKAEDREKRIQGKTTLYPYYGATGYVGEIDEYLIDGRYILLGEDGAPFLDKYATKAYEVNGKIWVNNHAHILSPKIDFEYLLYYLNAVDYSEYAKGTTRLKLTQSDMNKILIMLPPLNEQRRISQKVAEIFTAIDTIISNLKQS